MLNLSHVSVKRNQHVILQDISLQFPAGQFVAILGENGAGKSTLLSAICDDIPWQGEITLDNIPLAQYSAKILANRRAVMTQQTIAPVGLSVTELVALSRYAYTESPQTSQHIALKWLEALQLGGLAKRDLQQLSGGQLQRTHFARCLAQLDNNSPTPKLLLLDEPTSALDIHHQHRCLHLAYEFAQAGNLVLAVMHDLNLAALYADHIILLDQGKLLAYGPPQQVLQAAELSRLYRTSMFVSAHPRLRCPIIFSEPHTRCGKPSA